MFCVKNIVFSWFFVQVVLCLMTAQAKPAEATVCAPLSRFKMDCNTCYCSLDGYRYTCTKRFCTSDVSLNYNDFMSDAPQNDNNKLYFDEPSDDWVRFLNDLAASSDDNGETENKGWQKDENEYQDNAIDYGDYLKEDTEYIGSRKNGYRY